MNQKTLGVVYSYLCTFLQIVVSLFIPSFLIRILGKTDYGIYQMAQSFAGNLLVFNFGIATIMSRNLVKYRYQKNEKGILQTTFNGILSAGLTSCLTIIIGGILALLITPAYQKTLTSPEIGIVFKLYFIFMCSNTVYVWQRWATGISTGYERFGFTNGLNILVQLLRVCLLIVLVAVTRSVFAVAVVEICANASHFLIEYIYCRKRLSVPIVCKKEHFDKFTFREFYTFGVAALLQSITRQVNISMPKIVVGMYMTAADVSLYSVVTTLTTAYITITKLIGSVYLPDATRLAVSSAPPTAYRKMMWLPMLLQATISFAILFGFAVLGKPFLRLWMGDGFEAMWFAVMTVFLPLSIANLATLPDIVLDAKLKKLSRSITLIFTTIINITLSIFLVQKYGTMGAAIGSASAYLLGNIILMGIVYKRIIGVNVLSLYSKLALKIFPCGILAAAGAYALQSMLHDHISLLVLLIICVVVFMLIYAMCIWYIALTSEEKQWALRKVRQFTKEGRV
ncbi:oligosaccharide flippase family protein [Eubacteriales bacterium OttesenSCG-928-A19]|nr:oligosaccharide flippase family protein [Eubacteriales bacterium OttesenSCG-928-A19]